MVWRVQLNDRFHQIAHTFLDVLTKRVQVGRKVGAGWVDALLILAFRFTGQLFPPFGKHRHVRLVVFQQLRRKAFTVKDVAVSSVLVGLVLRQVWVGV